MSKEGILSILLKGLSNAKPYFEILLFDILRFAVQLDMSVNTGIQTSDFCPEICHLSSDFCDLPTVLRRRSPET